MSAQPAATKRLSLSHIRRMKGAEPITMLTAYDASMAHLMDEAGVDIILVGDSLGMVIQGHETTIPVTLDHMIYHTQAVLRGSRRALIMADLPFMSYTSPEAALASCCRLMQEAGAQIIKLEGGAPQVETVKQLSHHGVPVCAHLGLQPQSVHKIGGYKVQGRDDAAAEQMEADALALSQAGADMLLLECVPAKLATHLSQLVDLPVIGIGAGVDCDGQVLVLQDILGITPKPPSFSQNFMPQADSIQGAIKAYTDAVKDKRFPTADQAFE